jgi:hypothetical protein
MRVPVEQPTKFELVVNLTRQTLGLRILESLPCAAISASWHKADIQIALTNVRSRGKADRMLKCSNVRFLSQGGH